LSHAQHPEDWGEALQICVDLILTNGNIFDTSKRSVDGEQFPVFSANPDLSYANQFHLMRLTNGAFHVCLAAVYKVSHSPHTSPIFLYRVGFVC
jgi:hypothetical protein